jgi:hypothetical protein
MKMEFGLDPDQRRFVFPDLGELPMDAMIEFRPDSFSIFPLATRELTPQAWSATIENVEMRPIWAISVERSN